MRVPGGTLIWYLAEMFILDFSSADKSSTAKKMNIEDKAENTLKQA